MADVTITAAEVGLLDALPGGLLGLGVYYVPATLPAQDEDGAESGSVGQDHGELQAFSDAPKGALATAGKALDKVRTDAPARAVAALATYAEIKHGEVLNGGIRVDVGAGVTADVVTTDKGRGLVTGCIGLADLAAKLRQPEPTFPWVNNDGSPLTLSLAQMQIIAYALGVFTQETYAALGQVGPGLAAGTITDTAAIDALPWPATIG